MPAGHGTARAIASRISSAKSSIHAHNTHARTYVGTGTISPRSKVYIVSKAKNCKTSIKIIKNEIGCRDDTVPKTVGTRRHCEEDGEHATIFRNPLPTSRFLGVAEDCCLLSILLAVPSCTYSFWHGVIPTSYFIFNDFYTCHNKLRQGCF